MLPLAVLRDALAIREGCREIGCGRRKLGFEVSSLCGVWSNLSTRVIMGYRFHACGEQP